MTTAVCTDDRFLVKNRHVRSSLTLAVSLLSASGAALSFAPSAQASPGSSTTAAAKATLQQAVTDTIDMIKSIDGIALAAFAVALVPMGFMLTLRVLNMVLSRV